VASAGPYCKTSAVSAVVDANDRSEINTLHIKDIMHATSLNQDILLFPHRECVEFISKKKKDHYRDNFMAYDDVEGKINFGDAVDVKKSPDNWEHKRHQRHDRLDLTATYEPSLNHHIHYRV